MTTVLKIVGVIALCVVLVVAALYAIAYGASAPIMSLLAVVGLGGALIWISWKAQGGG